MGRVKGGPESAPAFELLLAREGDQEDGVRRGDADRHDRAHERGDLSVVPVMNSMVRMPHKVAGSARITTNGSAKFW